MTHFYMYKLFFFKSTREFQIFSKQQPDVAHIISYNKTFLKVWSHSSDTPTPPKSFCLIPHRCILKSIEMYLWSKIATKSNFLFACITKLFQIPSIIMWYSKLAVYFLYSEENIVLSKPRQVPPHPCHPPKHEQPSSLRRRTSLSCISCSLTSLG